MKITLKSIKKITPYENNPRLNDCAVDAVAKSLDQFGWRQPIVVDAAGIIICGHICFITSQPQHIFEEHDLVNKSILPSKNEFCKARSPARIYKLCN